MTLELTQTPPNAPLLLWLSFSSTPQAVFGGTLHAVPMANQFLRFSDGAGAYSVSAPWPPGVPVGTKLWLQWLAGDASVASGITLSNAVRATTP